MKRIKTLIALTLLVGVLSLAGCAKLPQGVDTDFFNDGKEIFSQIDNDTMEYKQSDKSDYQKYEYLSASANTEREILFAERLGEMIVYQKDVSENKDGSLEDYLTARSSAMKAINMSDTGEGRSFPVNPFELRKSE